MTNSMKDRPGTGFARACGAIALAGALAVPGTALASEPAGDALGTEPIVQEGPQAQGPSDETSASEGPQALEGGAGTGSPSPSEPRAQAEAEADPPSPPAAYAAGLALDASNFPDAAFLGYLQATYDVDGDGALSDGEAAAITSLAAADAPGASDFTGINLLASLERIDLSGRKVGRLDLSGLANLKEANVRLCGLTALDVSGCTSLERLDCASNELTSLDASSCAALYKLDCLDNDLAALDVSGCGSLAYLNCMTNELTSLDVTGCPSLVSLSCEFNKLEELDVEGLQNLRTISCHPNRLTVLDFRTNPRLSFVHCAADGQTVLISAGMLGYVGCVNDPANTGNVVVDLEGYYEVAPDGTKTVDLTKVISTTLIDQITEGSPRWDAAASVLTIPAEEEATTIAAMKGNAYTFLTKAQAPAKPEEPAAPDAEDPAPVPGGSSAEGTAPGPSGDGASAKAVLAGTGDGAGGAAGAAGALAGAAALAAGAAAARREKAQR